MTTWVTCVNAGGVALVEEVSEAVGTWVTWTTRCMTCIVVDAGRVVLVEEVDEVVEVGWRCDCRGGVVVDVAPLSAVVLLSTWRPRHRNIASRQQG